MGNWTASEIPSQRGRTAVVTGTGGLGFQTALALAGAGATVIVAGRSRPKGVEAVSLIRQSVPGASVSFEALDLAALASVEAFGERLRHSLDGLDLLINNAGVMTPPTRRVTSDGFELQLGTNHLGHFALTARLLPLLRGGDEPRVVSVSSVAARDGAIDFDDLQSERGYKPMAAYSQSKLACLMFALELQRRGDAAGWGIRSIAAHPGISRTDLLPNGAGAWSAQGWPAACCGSCSSRPRGARFRRSSPPPRPRPRVAPTTVRTGSARPGAIPPWPRFLRGRWIRQARQGSGRSRSGSPESSFPPTGTRSPDEGRTPRRAPEGGMRRKMRGGPP